VRLRREGKKIKKGERRLEGKRRIRTLIEKLYAELPT
jgi:hypothetical protein